MRNPVVVLAVIAIIFGIFNIVLWFIIVKKDKETSSQGAKTGDFQNLITAAEKRLTDTLVKTFSSAGRQNSVDARKIAAEVASALKISEVRGMKKAVEDIPKKLDEVSEALKNISEELTKQKNFIEAIDGHLVEKERQGV